MMRRLCRILIRTVVPFSALLATCVSSARSYQTQNALASIPAFEEETESRSGPQYLWRQGGVEATLDQAGRISIRLPTGHTFRIVFPGASPIKPQGESPQLAQVFYYVGNAAHWHSNRRWSTVRYRNLYPGIDLVLLSAAGQLEYNFEVRAGTNPQPIRIQFNGVGIRRNSRGDLDLSIDGLNIKQRLPLAYQSGDGGVKQVVACQYRVDRGIVTLRPYPYDPERMLVIDPVLNFSTYFGGTSFDAIYAAAADTSGNLYVAGETSSGNLPNGSQPFRASRDAWVAKFNHAGTQLLYLVHLGGSANDQAKGVAVDSSGNTYIVGTTGSSDFPTTPGAFLTHNAGAQQAFVAKLNSSGGLLYSTYLGGNGSDAGLAIAVDSTGAAYVAGQAGSVNFPVTTGVLQASMRGGLSDCFVSKLNSLGAGLVYSTYLGGGAADLCSGIALDSSGHAYVTGTTSSTNFPVQAPIQSALLGSSTAFVAEVNAAGTALVYSTYLGGSAVDNGAAIAVDSTGAAYVAGSTASSDFPATAGAFQAVLLGTWNGFVAKFAPGGASLIYATVIGGSSSDWASAIAVDSFGQAVVGGYTSSGNFPVVNAIQSTFQGGLDAFAAVLNPNGSSLTFSSFFGGGGDDRAYGVAVLPASQFFLAGMTSSNNLPVASSMQGSLAGNYDGFALDVTYSAANSGQGAVFVSVPPCRIGDTRGNGFTGSFGPPFLPGGASRSFPIPQSSCGIPSSAQAYALNVTVYPHAGGLGYLTAWPTGSTQPIVSTLNAVTGAVVANAAIVPAGVNGAISLYVSDDTDVSLDITGYFAAQNSPQPLEFYPLTPCRVADTRGSGFSGFFGPPSLVGGVARSFPIPQSGCGAPTTSQAYSLRLTVVAPGTLQYLTAWATGLALPITTTLNAFSGGVVGNQAIVGAGTGEAISVYASNSTDVIIDINGYFAPPGGVGGLHFYPLPPCRVADTRGSGFTGAFGPPSMVGNAVRVFPMTSSSCGIPAVSDAYSLNFAVVNPPGGLAYLTAFPTGAQQPIVSTLNAATGGVVASASIVPAGTGGNISVYAHDPTDLVIDINGYFGP
jgi:hypothetical protein